jgi:hypothetical protein
MCDVRQRSAHGHVNCRRTPRTRRLHSPAN